MALHADTNLYPGINIHLNSILQNEPGGWESFHIEYIVALRETVEKRLPFNYYCRTGDALQYSEYEEKPLVGIAIYQIEKGNLRGNVVTCIELLTPANKPGGAYHEQYMVKRREALEAGLSLVEVDFLHQSAPIVRQLPDYSKQEKRAHPFMIVVTRVQSTIMDNSVDVYAFGVDDPLPTVDAPLTEGDVVRVVLGAAYNRMFESSRFFRLVVDYEQEPLEFARYHEADRQLIQQRLSEIRKVPR